jgi:hypothetical protein
VAAVHVALVSAPRAFLGFGAGARAPKIERTAMIEERHFEISDTDIQHACRVLYSAMADVCEENGYARVSEALSAWLCEEPSDHGGLVKRAAALAIAGASLALDAFGVSVGSANAAVPADAEGAVHVHYTLEKRKIAPPRVSVRYSLKPVRKEIETDARGMPVALVETVE